MKTKCVKEKLSLFMAAMLLVMTFLPGGAVYAEEPSATKLTVLNTVKVPSSYSYPNLVSLVNMPTGFSDGQYESYCGSIEVNIGKRPYKVNVEVLGLNESPEIQGVITQSGAGPLVNKR